jgi:hypothetical protein
MTEVAAGETSSDQAEDDRSAAGMFMAWAAWPARCGLDARGLEDLLVGGNQADAGGGWLPGAGVAVAAVEAVAGRPQVYIHAPVHLGRRRRPARAGHGRVGRDATGRGGLGWAGLGWA